MGDVDVVDTENVTSGAQAGVSSTLRGTVAAKHDDQREFYKLLCDSSMRNNNKLACSSSDRTEWAVLLVVTDECKHRPDGFDVWRSATNVMRQTIMSVPAAGFVCLLSAVWRV
ncbi:hypothetical protein ERJ75_000501400 [Trypanosoma vivax]|nr:hypothetical protein ERJ75_001704300 [Trypanosoma vivax]KAH8604666.1 hypothetical protein ERJ75_001695900 [Trypanosoma vivax]KAH8605231.1 hypothetical protein ERJ75_001637800 [Trypanosoma vivax]KAH8606599.1 hypothetical protein ERJ75_001497300 [Trypanosoma vivax]KAH8616225.1 hypothetical protein ERJ75_000501400 [Trypanosoma vivax]